MKSANECGNGWLYEYCDDCMVWKHAVVIFIVISEKIDRNHHLITEYDLPFCSIFVFLQRYLTDHFGDILTITE